MANGKYSSLKKTLWLSIVFVAFVSLLVFASIIESKDGTLLEAISNDDLQAVQKLLEKHPELANTLIHRKGKVSDIYPLNYAI